MPRDSIALFLHGLFSRPPTWDRVIAFLDGDPYVRAHFQLLRYRYSSERQLFPPLSSGPPGLAELSAGLKTFMETDSRVKDARRIALIGHSLGGLIIQRYLAAACDSGNAAELRRIRSVILLATPNSGSAYLLPLRRLLARLGLWRHAQELALRPLDADSVRAQRTVLCACVYASCMSSTKCPIPVTVCAAANDRIVTRLSAEGMFPAVDSLPGDHFTVLSSPEGSQATALLVLRALKRCRQAVLPTRRVIDTAALTDASPTELNAVYALMVRAFTTHDSVRRDDLHYWCERYEHTFPGIELSLLVAKLNDQLVGFAMFHEDRSANLIIVDYLAADRQRSSLSRRFHFPVLTELGRQLIRRARESGIHHIVFELEHPQHSDRPRAALARLRRFSRLGARIIDGVSYVAPDMDGLCEPSSPYLLMHASPGRAQTHMTRAQVTHILSCLYNVWYRNWLSRHVKADEIASNLRKLLTTVQATVRADCPLITYERFQRGQ